MSAAITIENLSKKYSRRQEGSYIALRDVLANAFKKGQKKSEPFWALQDINLTINQGDRVGIIGRNGAGKSTLLKIISRITPPTTGRIEINGRVASLLEVGTGFHPELSGRENIYLNGSILGLKRVEINQRLDEIIQFSGVEDFIDSPLKHYSSGMQLRLAFSVAAHLEAEILLIDEVLAVGDMEFQKKCIGKMEEISKEKGRTIFFVSHNLLAIKNICTNSVWINSGKLQYYGDTQSVIEKFIDFNQTHTNNCLIINKEPTKQLFLKRIEFDCVKKEKAKFSLKEEINIKLEIVNNLEKQNVSIAFGVNHISGVRVLRDEKKVDITNNLLNLKIKLIKNCLSPGNYFIDFSLISHSRVIDFHKGALSFEITKSGTKYEHVLFDYGYIDQDCIWELSE